MLYLASGWGMFFLVMALIPIQVGYHWAHDDPDLELRLRILQAINTGISDRIHDRMTGSIIYTGNPDAEMAGFEVGCFPRCSVFQTIIAMWPNVLSI